VRILAASGKTYLLAGHPLAQAAQFRQRRLQSSKHLSACRV